MAWRVVGVTNPARLSSKNNQLVIEQDEAVTIPIEDIDSLVIDSYGITATATLLTTLTSNGVSVVICNEQHLPSSVLLPYEPHSRQALVSSRQLSMSVPLKKQLWQRIIIQKITNQATVLNVFGFDGNQLIATLPAVRSGDSTNRESQAARYYFGHLLDGATRRQPLLVNAALNYSYAIVRSHIARHIAARGLASSIGLGHRSQLNNFNLADDLLEPFRPLIDEYVLGELGFGDISEQFAELTREQRASLVDVLNIKVKTLGKSYLLKYAVDLMVESLVQSILETDSSKLALPGVVKSKKV